MNRRLALAVIAVALLAASAGCLNYIQQGGEPDDEVLDREPAEPYEWETDRDGHLSLHTADEVQAVYRVDEGQTLRLYQSTGLGTEGPLDIAAVRFQDEDGTELTGTELRDSEDGDIDQTPEEVFVTAPADGRLAFSAGATPRRLSLPVFVEGSYEVVLPEDYRMDFFLFGNANPRGAQTEIIDNRVHITWDEVTHGPIVAQYYLERDLYIFAGAVVILSVIASGGLYYYRRQIDRLHDVRVSMGLDVEDDDEEDQ